MNSLLGLTALVLSATSPRSASGHSVHPRSPHTSRAFSYASSYATSRFATFNSSGGVAPVAGVPLPEGYSHPHTWNQGHIVLKETAFDLLKPRGLRISVQEPNEPSPEYDVTFYINVNQPFSGEKRGMWEGKAKIPKGGKLSYTFPDIVLKKNDVLYYWTTIKGKDTSRSWYRQYTGYYSVPGPDSHSPVDPPPQNLNIPQYPVVGSQPSESNYLNRKTDVAINKGDTTKVFSNPNVKDEPSEKCQESLTTFNYGRKTCVGELFTKNIDFERVEKVPGNEPEDKFTIFLNENIMPNQTSNGTFITITPSLLEDRYGAGFVDKSITLLQCTSKEPELCRASAEGNDILPPILSGRETTERSVSFKYGVLEVMAKLPKGEWIVPELWLLPKDRVYGDKSGKIVLAMSRGNPVLSDGDRDYSGKVLEAGVVIGSKPIMFRKNHNKLWSNDYHVYKLVWTPDQIRFYVDNDEIGIIRPGENALDPSLQGTELAPFDQEFYLSFGVHVGGDEDFPDTLIGKPWLNGDSHNKKKFWQARNKWQPSWTSADTGLHIAEISLKALS